MMQLDHTHCRKYLTEAIGTFFLVFTIGTCATTGVNTFFAAAAILTAFIYAGAPISGAHYNPAVTVGIWLRGRLESALLLPYIVAQCIGAALAAAAVRFSIGHTNVFADVLIGRFERPHFFNDYAALLAEFLFTFALVFVVLHTATSRRSSGNQYYGLAIGFTLLAGILSVGTISGAAFNPAVALSLPLMGLATWQNTWIYLVGNLAGAAVAAYSFRFLNPDDI
jgi:aquaporin Z